MESVSGIKVKRIDVIPQTIQETNLIKSNIPLALPLLRQNPNKKIQRNLLKTPTISRLWDILITGVYLWYKEDDCEDIVEIEERLVWTELFQNAVVDIQGICWYSVGGRLAKRITKKR